MRRRPTALLLLISWGLATAVGAAYFVRAMRQERREAFLPGRTTDGHYQIENRCDVCHTPLMGVKQDACVKCHGEDLREANDSHPEAKFNDPRNADRSAKLDAQKCITCHVEHRPEITGAMGFTLPADACRVCHADVAQVRPSHVGAKFEGCATSGCHNFHDNRALYEDFLLKHQADPAIVEGGAVPLRDFAAVFRALKSLPEGALKAEDADAPAEKLGGKIVGEWAASGHAAGRVNCADCHGGGATGRPWTDRATMDACKTCHPSQTKTFLEGRHGMRLTQGLDPMTPGMARIAMRADAAGKALDCQACHPAHRDDSRAAAVEACLKCHNDAHSLAYKGSPHELLWKDELAGRSPPGSGVSCATCHMPRSQVQSPEGETHIAARHNQNANLRPNEKMAREVCLHCHGLPFTLDALADADGIRANFREKPKGKVKSVEWAAGRAEALAKEKREKEKAKEKKPE